MNIVGVTVVSDFFFFFFFFFENLIFWWLMRWIRGRVRVRGGLRSGSGGVAVVWLDRAQRGGHFEWSEVFGVALLAELWSF
jgi:hypothetical protein